jgi:hypothetical protein
VLIEFVGVPGAGKSTLSRLVADRLIAEGCPVSEPSHWLDHGTRPWWRRLRKAWMLALELLAHPCNSVRVARRIAATKQREFGALWRLIANWLVVTSLTRRARRRGGCSVFDQGRWQALWSIALDARSGGEVGNLHALLDRLPAPDLVVVVDAAVDTAKDRLDSRRGGDSRVERAPGRADEMLFRGRRLVLDLAGLGERSMGGHGVGVLRLRNDPGSDLQLLARRVVAGALEVDDSRQLLPAPPQRRARLRKRMP